MSSKSAVPVNEFIIHRRKARLFFDSGGDDPEDPGNPDAAYSLVWEPNRPKKQGTDDIHHRSDWQILFYLAFLLAPPKDRKIVFFYANDVVVPVTRFAVGGEVLLLYSHLNRPACASFSLYHGVTNIQHAMSMREVFNVLSQFLEDNAALD